MSKRVLALVLGLALLSVNCGIITKRHKIFQLKNGQYEVKTPIDLKDFVFTLQSFRKSHPNLYIMPTYMEFSDCGMPFDKCIVINIGFETRQKN